MLAYKHHISEHFEEDPSLVFDNGAGKGGTVFLDYDKMVDYLMNDGRRWHICTLEVNINELKFEFNNDWMATILVNKKAIDYFKPLIFKE